MKGFIFWLSLAAATTLAHPVAAQDEDEEIICVAVAHAWGGTPDDLRRIREEPVPASFRETFEGGGCPRWQLIESSLLAWHFAFGDEQTAIAAAEYLDARSVREPLETALLEGQLQEAWAEAYPVLQQISALYTARNYEEANRLRREAPELAALDRLLARIGGHRFVADSWLSGARFFSSATMVRRARSHMDVILAFERFLASVETENALLGDAAIEAGPDWDIEKQLVAARYATLRAALLGEAEALPPPSTARFTDAQDELENYLQEGRLLQELDSNEPDFELFAQEVEENSNWAAHQILLWREEAFADMARGTVEPTLPHRPCQSQRLDLAMAGLEALERDGNFPGEILGYHSTAIPPIERDNRIALLLAQVDCLRNAAEQAVVAEQPGEAHRALGIALYILASARQLVQPDEHPGRFRQIAMRYLDGLDRCREFVAWSRRGTTCAGSQDTRLQVYFETNLAALDAIALGAERIED